MSLLDERFRLKCPNCGATYVYHLKNLDAEGYTICQNCNQRIRAEGQPVTAVPEEKPMEPYVPEEKPTEPYVPYEKRQDETIVTVGKLYGHGFIFSILSLLIAFLFVFLVVFLTFFGGLVGLILSFVLLCGMVGYANIGLANVLWGIKCKNEPQSVLAQGGVIFMIMIVMSLVFLPFTLLAFQIVLLLDFLVYPVIYGFVFRRIALEFEIGKKEEYGAVSSGFQKGVCPHCNAKYAYALSSRDSEGNVRCQNCSQVFKLEIRPELQPGPDID